MLTTVNILCFNLNHSVIYLFIGLLNSLLNCIKEFFIKVRRTGGMLMKQKVNLNDKLLKIKLN